MKAGDLARGFWISCVEANKISAMLVKVICDRDEQVQRDLGRIRLISYDLLTFVARVDSNAAMTCIRPCHRSVIAHDDQPD